MTFTVDPTSPSTAPPSPGASKSSGSFYKDSGIDYTTPIVSVVAPTNIVPPVITGSAAVGSTLTNVPGTWTGSPTVTRQWKADGVNISGATALTLLLLHAQASRVITVTETATNAVGSLSVTSLPTASVTEVPSPITAPSINGVPTEGNNLTVVPGTWNGAPAPTLTYLWLSNGSSTGVGGTVYTLTSGDVGNTISVRETATNSTGSATSVSAGVGPVAALGGGFTPSLDFSDARNSQYIGQLV
jgi:hypothetical protein